MSVYDLGSFLFREELQTSSVTGKRESTVKKSNLVIEVTFVTGSSLFKK